MSTRKFFFVVLLALLFSLVGCTPAEPVIIVVTAVPETYAVKPMEINNSNEITINVDAGADAEGSGQADQAKAEAKAEATAEVVLPTLPPTATAVSTDIMDSLEKCVRWEPGETRDLNPGETALGDIKVNGEVRYDSGTGEGTVVVNNGTEPVSIYAEWGARCVVSTDIPLLVKMELEQTGCGNEPCDTVRVVEFSTGSTIETFYP